MKDFFKNNLLAILVCLSITTVIASATTITRPYTSADYAGGAKAVGSKVNAEFQSIVDWLNNGNISTGNIANLGVVTANINTGAVTRVKLEDVGQKVTSSSGVFNTNATDAIAITNLSTTITTVGRPVMIMLSAGTTINGAYVGFRNPTTLSASGNLAFIRDSATVALQVLTSGTVSTGGNIYVPCSSFSYMDAPTAGTYTYSVKIKSIVSSTTAVVENCKLVVFEL